MIHTPIIVAVLIGIGVVGIALVILVLLRLVVGAPIQRIIIARRIWFGCVSVLRLFMILRLGHRPCIALQRMHRTGVVLRLGILDRAFLSVGALQPGRRTRGRPELRLKVRLKIRLERALIIIARTGARRCLVFVACARAWQDLMIGATHGAGRIGLTNQAREFGQRVAFASRVARILAGTLVRGKTSFLIPISHRVDASPSGYSPTHPTDEPAYDAAPRRRSPRITASRLERERRERLIRKPEPRPRPELKPNAPW